MRRALTALTLVAVTAALTAAPAEARRTPGSFTGYAFDTCHTPSQAQMDRWLTHSPYWGVGVYIAGDNRACPDELSLNLTPTWVSSQTRKGWRILPLTVGRQAACYKPGRADVAHVDDDPAGGYAAARAQGRAEASATVAASRSLGIARRSTQWLDVEAFTGDQDCRLSTLAFVQAWTDRLHDLGYKSGFYSSAASGIAVLDQARRAGEPDLPDQIWIAEWNSAANSDSAYVADEAWRKQRIHQYQGGHDERYGGVRINIDSNWMDVGRGSRAPKPSPHCRIRVDFPSYGTLRRGSRSAKVSALKCLLRQKHVYRGRLTQRYDERTAKAVKRFQRRHDLPRTGRTTKRTWVTLLSAGRSPFMKIGAASNSVRRLQRALNAATKSRLDVTGVYDKRTARAVKHYQRARRLPRTGVTTSEVWVDLHRGKR